VHRLGWLYVLLPAGLGAIVLLIVALLVNNLAPNRRYPEFW
jgi:CBS-domain-containing membrane protein